MRHEPACGCRAGPESPATFAACYEVTLSASGEAVITVEAADADEAVEVALRSTPGMTVEGGSCEWDVERVVWLHAVTGGSAATESEPS